MSSESNDVAGLLNTFLSWRAWAPLSRLTYGVYLFHPIIISVIIWNRTDVFYLSTFNVVRHSVDSVNLVRKLFFLQKTRNFETWKVFSFFIIPPLSCWSLWLLLLLIFFFFFFCFFFFFFFFCPRRLTFSWWGCYCLSLRHKPRELANSFYFVLVSVSIFMDLSTVFHSINSPYNSPLSHSVLLVVCLPHWAFQLSLYQSLPQPGCNPLCLTGLKASTN